MRELSTKKLFILAALILTLGTFLPACTGVPKDTRPQVYIAADGYAYVLQSQATAVRIDVIPENAIVTRYRPYSERLHTETH